MGSPRIGRIYARTRGHALVAGVALLVCAGAPAAAAQSFDPDVSPAGSNDFSCRPSGEHPLPVVLVHGLGTNQSQNWSYMAPRVRAAGYCVFSLTYGLTPTNPPPFDRMGGTRPIEESAGELEAFVDRVLAATGATKVALVGHSEGTMLSGWYTKNVGGSAKVDRIVALTPVWRGTNVALAGTLSELGEPSGIPGQIRESPFGRGCPACFQLLKGSEFVDAFNSGAGPVVPGVTYTNVMTRYDELVVPYWSGWLRGTTNIVLQRVCPADPSEHAALAFSPIVLRIIKNALDPAAAEPVDCSDAAGF